MNQKLLIDVPAVTREQMAEVDRLMIEIFHISLEKMMENAGRNLADLAQMMLEGSASGKRIAVFCGGGNNGGGGMAAARHLSNRGAQVIAAVSRPERRIKPAALEQYRALQQMGVAVTDQFPDGPFDLIVDALIGYGLDGAPRGKTGDWIDHINQLDVDILSLDIPSGMDADSGNAAGPCVCAAATMTLALPKIGFLKKESRQYSGEIYAADISVPSQILNLMGIPPTNIFIEESIVKLICTERLESENE